MYQRKRKMASAEDKYWNDTGDEWEKKQEERKEQKKLGDFE